MIHEPKRALTNPLTANPSIKDAAKSNKKALITNINNPSVRMVIGSVNKTKIGFTNIFSKPITSAVTTATNNPSTVIPWNNM